MIYPKKNHTHGRDVIKVYRKQQTVFFVVFYFNSSVSGQATFVGNTEPDRYFGLGEKGDVTDYKKSRGPEC